MTGVGTADVRIPLADLLPRVERGERIMITRNGHPVALLAPAPVETDAERKARLDLVTAAIRKLRDENGPTLGPDLTIQQLRDEGRR